MSLVMLAYLFFSVLAQCEQIFRENGGQYGCGVGIGWFCLAAGLAGTGGYSGWMLYRLNRREGRARISGCDIPITEVVTFFSKGSFPAEFTGRT